MAGTLMRAEMAEQPGVLAQLAGARAGAAPGLDPDAPRGLSKVTAS